MTDLAKYKKVRAERDVVEDTIIRVNRKTPATTFVDDIVARFVEKNAKEVTLSSLGAAISKTITIAEVVKHRVPGVHQLNEIKTIVLDDAYEPLADFKEELNNMTVERKLTCFQIVLSLQAPKNSKVAGYQAPIPLSEVTAEQGPDDLDQVNNQRRQRKEKKDDETAEKLKV